MRRMQETPPGIPRACFSCHARAVEIRLVQLGYGRKKPPFLPHSAAG